MTRSDEAPAPTAPSRDTPPRRGFVAAVTSLVLALAVLVAPGAQATDDVPPVTIGVVQDETWWEGGGERGLAATAVGPDGEPVTGGEYAVQVGAAVRYDLPWTDGRLTVDAGRLTPGEVAVTVAWRPADDQPWTTGKATFEVSRGTIPSTVTVTAPSFVEYGGTAYAEVSVAVEDGTRAGDVALFMPAWSTTHTMDQTQIDPTTGTGRLKIAAPGPGTTNEFEVVFYGRGGVATSRASLTLEVGKTQPQMQLSSLPSGGRWSVGLAPWSVHVDLGYRPISDGTVSLHDEAGRLLTSRAVADMRNGRGFFDVRADQLSVGRHTIEVRLTGSSTVADGRRRADVTVTKEKAGIAFDAMLPGPRWGVPHDYSVDVVDAEQTGGPRRTGTVTLYRGKTRLWTGPISGHGDATPRLGGKALPVGRSTIRVVYSGDRYYAPATVNRSVTVRKAETRIRATLVDTTVVGNQRVKVRLRISSPSHIPDVGKVRIKVDGKVVKTVQITKKHDGRRTVTLPPHHGSGHVTAVLVATPTTKSARSQDRYFDAS